MKKILGLDLGSNSIGWSVIDAIAHEDGVIELEGIDSAGSRVIPTSQAILGKFGKGESVSQTKDRTEKRSARRIRERQLLRRARLLRVLNEMEFLPKHFAECVDEYGNLFSEVLLPWRKNDCGKYEFLFQNSFLEMLADFRMNQPDLVSEEKRIPLDWTIYYLRKKALTEKISKEELAWVILNFNQKRGYYQLRGEESELDDNTKEYYALKVIGVSRREEQEDIWYDVTLENGWIYNRKSKVPLDEWVGQTKEFIVTTTKNKKGDIKRSFSIPGSDDWTLIKKKTENDIEESGKKVGDYIYETLLRNPNQKVRGRLIRTVERRYYKDELVNILEKQKEFHPELQNRDLYCRCIDLLYSRNDAHRVNLEKQWQKQGFTALFVDDIIFYQRPLKSKKSLIGDCPYEERVYVDEQGVLHHKPIKCIAKSNPLFQEFRLWQFISNLKIYKRQTEAVGELDVTQELLPDEEAYGNLYEWMNKQDLITQEKLIYKYFKIKEPKGKNPLCPYRWNYVEEKQYPGNRTRYAILSKLEEEERNSLSRELEEKIWHLLYSVTIQEDIDKALTKNISEKSILNTLRTVFSDDTIKKLKNIKFKDENYGAYSAKAINRLLPLMRMGKYWSFNAIDDKTQIRIERIINGEYDESIKLRTRTQAISLVDKNQFKGLPLWLACYVVYDRHSEAKVIERWRTPEDIDQYLSRFKQHSLRNPIVEQVVLETLRTVRDIWKKVGKIDEIHIELGRDMKQTKEERAQRSETMSKNEDTKLRIKTMLMEFANSGEIENVRPYSARHQDILRIYEEGALLNLNESEDDYKDIKRISTMSQPSSSDIQRYRCWLEQRYCSPYTGEVIPLSKLFTSAYEIEHIIPQSRYFDDSFSNKVICESEVNKLKDNELGYEFISKHPGELVQLSNGRSVRIFSIERYKEFVQKHYATNRLKMKKLLMEDIPDDFIQRQLNDTRYISKLVKTLLSNIVREEDEEEATSKNVIVCNGAITDRLKKDWGINDVWNHIVLPRFKRLTNLVEDIGISFVALSKEGHLIPQVPLEYQKGFNKKRIDHRHHAMDAIVIACTTREHVHLLNNECAKSEGKIKYQLSRKLRKYEWNQSVGREVPKEFILPWQTFPQDVEQVLKGIIVSFKQNLRVLSKSSNYYQHYKDNSTEKEFRKQEKGDNLTPRKPLHKETFAGEVYLNRDKEVNLEEALRTPKRIINKDLKIKILNLYNRGLDVKEIKQYFKKNKDIWSDINLSKIKVLYNTREELDPETGLPKIRYFATRKDLVSLFSGVKIDKAKKLIGKITDADIQEILIKHLENKDNNTELAFSPEGIDEMNRIIKTLNNGKEHKPIYKVKVAETGEMRFPLGTTGNNPRKFVEVAEGTNLYFAIYENPIFNEFGEVIRKERTYKTLSLNEVMEQQRKIGKTSSQLESKIEIAPNDKYGNPPIFVLSPNDLVYLPTEEERISGDIKLPLDNNRIYKMVSCSKKQLFFIPYFVAISICQKNKEDKKIDLAAIELGSNNKAEKGWTPNGWTENVIKDICIPIEIDRLGNVISINGRKI